MGVRALSRIVRNMRYAGPTPSARVATTNSRSLSERVLARVRRANEGMLTTPTASIALNDPGPRIAMMTIASRMAGTASRKSSTRMIAASASPPAKPPEEAEWHAHGSADEHGDGAGEERDARPVDHAAQDVATELVGAERVGKGRRLELVRAVLDQWVLGRDPGCQDSHGSQNRQHDTGDEPGTVAPDPSGTSNHGREQSTGADPTPQGWPGAGPGGLAGRAIVRVVQWHGCCFL